MNLPQKSGFRIVHTADWHLGKPLGELDRLAESRAFLDWLLGVIETAEADLLVVSGDVFDSATPPQAAQRLYFEFLATLYRKGGCEVIVTAGNHDSPGQLESPRQVLEVAGTRVVGALPEGGVEPLLIPVPFEAAAPRLVVAAFPFLRERDLRIGQPGQSATEIASDLREGVARLYREAAEAAERRWPGTPAIALGHLTALGSTGSESEREIHVGGLGAVGADAFPAGFRYIALGHLHRPQKIGGKENIRYSGSPIALSFGEASDEKEIRLLELSPDGTTLTQTALPVPLTRRLIRLKLSRLDAEQTLATWLPPEAPLPAWVEVTITDAIGGEGDDLCRRVRDAAKGRPFEIVRVITQRQQPLGNLAEEAGDDPSLLAEPRTVFARRLEEEPLPEDEKAALTQTFEELFSLYEERQRTGETPPAR